MIATKFVFIEAASGNTVTEKWIINPSEEERIKFIEENQEDVNLMNVGGHTTRRSMVIDYKTPDDIKNVSMGEFIKMPFGMFIKLMNIVNV